MLALDVQQDQRIDVFDRQGKHLGHLSAVHHGNKVKLYFHGLDGLCLERRPVGAAQPATPRRSA